MNKYKVVRNETESVIVESVLNFSDFNKTVFSGHMIEQLNDSNVCIKIGFGMNENLTECDLFNVLKTAEVNADKSASTIKEGEEMTREQRILKRKLVVLNAAKQAAKQAATNAAKSNAAMYKFSAAILNYRCEKRNVNSWRRVVVDICPIQL